MKVEELIQALKGEDPDLPLHVGYELAGADPSCAEHAALLSDPSGSIRRFHVYLSPVPEIVRSRRPSNDEDVVVLLMNREGASTTVREAIRRLEESPPEERGRSVFVANLQKSGMVVADPRPVSYVGEVEHPATGAAVVLAAAADERRVS